MTKSTFHIFYFNIFTIQWHFRDEKFTNECRQTCFWLDVCHLADTGHTGNCRLRISMEDDEPRLVAVTTASRQQATITEWKPVLNTDVSRPRSAGTQWHVLIILGVTASQNPPQFNKPMLTNTWATDSWTFIIDGLTLSFHWDKLMLRICKVSLILKVASETHTPIITGSSLKTHLVELQCFSQQPFWWLVWLLPEVLTPYSLLVYISILLDCK